jgi:cyclic dehypoxanthinyl futalosine synthase
MKAAPRKTTPGWKSWLQDAERGALETPDAWLPHCEEVPLEPLMEAADRIRWKKRPEPFVGYVIDRNVNYSNVCDAVCNFCAFYRKPGDQDSYTLSYEQIRSKVEETQALGGSGILMQGGLHPELRLEWYEDLLSRLQDDTGIYLHCFSPPEIWYFHEHFGIPIEEVLLRLKVAGLQSIPGGGAEILVDEIRKKITTKCTGEQWIEVSRVAHQVGLKTTATMMFGTLDEAIHRLRHMEMIRALQEETGGFLSFIPWTFQPDNTALGRAFPERQPPEVFLRWLAISRLYLQNIENIQVSWLTQGLDVGRRGLRGGANDMGSIMIEENVISQAGAKHQAKESLLVGVIREEGFLPRRRDSGYHWLEPVPA